MDGTGVMGDWYIVEYGTGFVPTGASEGPFSSYEAADANRRNLDYLVRFFNIEVSNKLSPRWYGITHMSDCLMLRTQFKLVLDTVQ